MNAFKIIYHVLLLHFMWLLQRSKSGTILQLLTSKSLSSWMHRWQRNCFSLQFDWSWNSTNWISGKIWICSQLKWSYLNGFVSESHVYIHSSYYIKCLFHILLLLWKPLFYSCFCSISTLDQILMLPLLLELVVVW